MSEITQADIELDTDRYYDILEGEVVGNIHDNPDLLEENKWN